MNRTRSLPLLLVAGCTIGETDVLAGGDRDDASVVSDAQVQADTQAFDGGVDLSGTWAQLLIYGTVFNLPAIGQTEGQTTNLLLLSISDSDQKLQVTAETCVVEIDNGTEIIETVVPDRFIRALDVEEPGATVEMDGTTMRYRQDRVLSLRGVALDDPVGDDLPEDASDPRVFDQDEDGHPGMTVLIRGLTDGEVYVIQRDWYVLEGEATGPDWIDGLAEWSTEQVVLGSDNEILNAQTDSSPHPDPSESYFRMTKVPDGTDCAAVVAQRKTLFER